MVPKLTLPGLALAWLIRSALAAGEGVAVRRRLLEQRQAELTARTRPVFDHQRLAETLADLRGDEADQDVATVAGRRRAPPG